MVPRTTLIKGLFKMKLNLVLIFKNYLGPRRMEHSILRTNGPKLDGESRIKHAGSSLDRQIKRTMIAIIMSLIA